MTANEVLRRRLRTRNLYLRNHLRKLQLIRKKLEHSVRNVCNERRGKRDRLKSRRLAAAKRQRQKILERRRKLLRLQQLREREKTRRRKRAKKLRIQRQKESQVRAARRRMAKAKSKAKAMRLQLRENRIRRQRRIQRRQKLRTKSSTKPRVVFHENGISLLMHIKRLRRLQAMRAKRRERRKRQKLSKQRREQKQQKLRLRQKRKINACRRKLAAIRSQLKRLKKLQRRLKQRIHLNLRLLRRRRKRQKEKHRKLRERRVKRRKTKQQRELAAKERKKRYKQMQKRRRKRKKEQWQKILKLHRYLKRRRRARTKAMRLLWKAERSRNPMVKNEQTTQKQKSAKRLEKLKRFKRRQKIKWTKKKRKNKLMRRDEPEAGVMEIQPKRKRHSRKKRRGLKPKSRRRRNRLPSSVKKLSKLMRLKVINTKRRVAHKRQQQRIIKPKKKRRSKVKMQTIAKELRKQKNKRKKDKLRAKQKLRQKIKWDEMWRKAKESVEKRKLEQRTKKIEDTMETPEKTKIITKVERQKIKKDKAPRKVQRLNEPAKKNFRAVGAFKSMQRQQVESKRKIQKVIDRKVPNRESPNEKEEHSSKQQARSKSTQKREKKLEQPEMEKHEIRSEAPKQLAKETTLKYKGRNTTEKIEMVAQKEPKVESISTLTPDKPKISELQDINLVKKENASISKIDTTKTYDGKEIKSHLRESTETENQEITLKDEQLKRPSILKSASSKKTEQSEVQFIKSGLEEITISQHDQLVGQGDIAKSETPKKTKQLNVDLMKMKNEKPSTLKVKKPLQIGMKYQDDTINSKIAKIKKPSKANPETPKKPKHPQVDLKQPNQQSPSIPSVEYKFSSDKRKPMYTKTFERPKVFELPVFRNDDLRDLKGLKAEQPWIIKPKETKTSQNTEIINIKTDLDTKEPKRSLTENNSEIDSEIKRPQKKIKKKQPKKPKKSHKSRERETKPLDTPHQDRTSISSLVSSQGDRSSETTQLSLPPDLARPKGVLPHWLMATGSNLTISTISSQLSSFHRRRYRRRKKHSHDVKKRTKLGKDGSLIPQQSDLANNALNKSNSKLRHSRSFRQFQENLIARRKLLGNLSEIQLITSFKRQKSHENLPYRWVHGSIIGKRDSDREYSFDPHMIPKPPSIIRHYRSSSDLKTDKTDPLETNISIGMNEEPFKPPKKSEPQQSLEYDDGSSAKGVDVLDKT